MITLSGIFILILIAACALFWYRNNEIKELAIRICKQACDRRQVQLLDGTISLSRIRIKKTSNHFGIMRCFNFEYFNGEYRFTGAIFFFQKHLVDIVFDEQGEQKTITEKLLTPANDKEGKRSNVIPFPTKKEK